jgi:hypothetical protein
MSLKGKKIAANYEDITKLRIRRFKFFFHITENTLPTECNDLYVFMRGVTREEGADKLSQNMGKKNE